MLDKLEKDFGFNYESSASASYLVISTGLGEKLQKYQVEMISCNSIYGILPLEARYKDDKLCFYYNITSKLALSNFLKRRRLEKDEFLNIIGSITRVFLELRNYFLYDRCLVLHEDYIYINPGSFEISMVYIPIPSEIDTIGNFKDFMIRLIAYTVRINEKETDNFLHKVLNYIRLETFNLADFDKLIKSLKGTQTDSSDIQNDTHDSMRGSSRDEQVMVPRLGKAADDARSSQSVIENKYFSIKIPSPTVKQAGNKPGGHSGADVNRPKNRRKFGRTAVFLLVQTVIAATLVLSYDPLKSLNQDMTATYTGVGIIILAVEFLLARKLFTGSPEQNNGTPGIAGSKNPEVPQHKLPSIFDSITQKGNVAFKKHTENAGEEKIRPAKLPDTDMGDSREFTDDTHIQNNFETTVLSHTDREYPYLRSINGETPEEISITRQSFLIGRLKGQVDYVSEKSAIGKVHAEIITRDGLFFLKDLNSRNGSFVNGIRAESNKEYTIRDGDRITLANCDYIFSVPVKLQGIKDPLKAVN